MRAFSGSATNPAKDGLSPAVPDKKYMPVSRPGHNSSITKS